MDYIFPCAHSSIAAKSQFAKTIPAFPTRAGREIISCSSCLSSSVWCAMVVTLSFRMPTNNHLSRWHWYLLSSDSTHQVGMVTQCDLWLCDVQCGVSISVSVTWLPEAIQMKLTLSLALSSSCIYITISVSSSPTLMMEYHHNTTRCVLFITLLDSTLLKSMKEKSSFL